MGLERTRAPSPFSEGITNMIVKPGDIGPSCPRCGCNDTTVIRPDRPDSWFPCGVAHCNCDGCNAEFTFREGQDEAPPRPPST